MHDTTRRRRELIWNFGTWAELRAFARLLVSMYVYVRAGLRKCLNNYKLTPKWLCMPLITRGLSSTGAQEGTWIQPRASLGWAKAEAPDRIWGGTCRCHGLLAGRHGEKKAGLIPMQLPWVNNPTCLPARGNAKNGTGYGLSCRPLLPVLFPPCLPVNKEISVSLYEQQTCMCLCVWRELQCMKNTPRNTVQLMIIIIHTWSR